MKTSSDKIFLNITFFKCQLGATCFASFGAFHFVTGYSPASKRNAARRVLEKGLAGKKRRHISESLLREGTIVIRGEIREPSEYKVDRQWQWRSLGTLYAANVTSREMNEARRAIKD